MKKVILVGYMGCGKSIVSQELSKSNSIPCLELDDMIVNNAGMSINDIFLIKGELYFRKIEHQLFKKFLNSKEDLIISTGGGTPCYYDNFKLYDNENCISIYLKASIETLYDRLKGDKIGRPVLANLDMEDVKEFIAKQLFERSFYYNKSNKVIVVDKKSVAEIVNEINNFLP